MNTPTSWSKHGNMICCNHASLNFLRNEVIINLNIFHSFMENQVIRNIQSYLIIAKQLCWSEMSISKVLNNDRSQVILEVVEAIVVYSTSVEEREIVCCFLVFQDKGEWYSKNVQ